jgi:hypothetical protein
MHILMWDESDRHGEPSKMPWLLLSCMLISWATPAAMTAPWSSHLVWQQAQPFCGVKSSRILCACLTYGSPFFLCLHVLSLVYYWDVWWRTNHQHVSTVHHYRYWPLLWIDGQMSWAPLLLSSTDSKESKLNHHIMDNTAKSNSTQRLA